MCAKDPRPNFQEKRARYLAIFVPMVAWHTTLYAHPDVPTDTTREVADMLELVDRKATRRLALPAQPPSIYLYPSVEALREHSCASAVAVAYYHGAIHLAVGAQAELRQSMTHEYVHHVLMSNGISRPIWFQEGAAMEIAGDKPLGYWATWRKNPIELEQMVERFPKTARLDEATAFYAQAYAMTEFLQRLCLMRDGCGLGELANALIGNRADPETLFERAASSRGGDLARTSRVSLWADYVEQGNFPPHTLAALLKRAGLEVPRFRE